MNEKSLEFPGYRMRVKEAFKRCGLTQAELASRFGLSATQMSRRVNGVLPKRFADLETFAEAIGVPWEWLVVGPSGGKRAAGFQVVAPKAPAPGRDQKKEARF